jgi:hypothetical protein
LGSRKLRFLAVLLLVGVCAVPVGLSTFGRSHAAVAVSAGAPEFEFSEGSPVLPGEGPSADAAWFERQRAYPAAEIPPHALARAARQADHVTSTRLAALLPALDWASIGPRPINDLQGYLWGSGRVTAVAPVGDGTVAYIGAAQGGVWKTTDAGVHWAPVFDNAIGSGGTGLAIGSLTVDPVNSSTIYVGTGEPNLSIDSYFGGGIFKSTDAGPRSRCTRR